MTNIRMFSFEQKVHETVQFLREHESPEGYFLAFSGGKDSVVIYDLAVKAGVKFDAHYNNTQIDPPELRIFIRRNYPDMDWIPPKKTMFELIEEKRILPTGIKRFCCANLKEHSGLGRVLITGIRGAESTRRAKRKKVERATGKIDTTFVHPIFDWTDEEVWQYIRSNGISYCKLYDEGWARIGCIGCPMTSSDCAAQEFERYPGIKKAYLRALKKGLEHKPSKYFGRDYELMFEWWMSRLSVKEFLLRKEIEETGTFSGSMFKEAMR